MSDTQSPAPNGVETGESNALFTFSVREWAALALFCVGIGIFAFSGCPSARDAAREPTLVPMPTVVHERIQYCAYHKETSRTSDAVYDGPFNDMCAPSREAVIGQIHAYHAQLRQSAGCLVRFPLLARMREALGVVRS